MQRSLSPWSVVSDSTNRMPGREFHSCPSPPLLRPSRGAGAKSRSKPPNLSTSRSIGDLRSLRKKLRDVMPPVPHLDTSAAVTSMKNSDSPTSSPEPPPTPPTPPSAVTVANLTVTPSASSSKERGHKRMLQRVVRSAPPVLSGFRFGASARGGEAESESGSPLATSTPSSSVWRKPLPTIPQEGDDAVPRRDNDEEATRTKAKPALRVEQCDSGRVDLEQRQVPRHRLSNIAHRCFSWLPKASQGSDDRCWPPIRRWKRSVPFPTALYKGSIPLQKGWFPSLQWDGLTIEVC